MSKIEALGSITQKIYFYWVLNSKMKFKTNNETLFGISYVMKWLTLILFVMIRSVLIIRKNGNRT